MLSKRANVFYLEHVRLIQKDDRVVYLTETGSPVEQFVAIPDKNTVFIILGKGTSITDSAMRKLAESNVVVGFSGSGGSPLFGAMDINFILPTNEYRPTEYMQAWILKWLTEETRVFMGRQFLRERARLDGVFYESTKTPLPDDLINTFMSRIDSAVSTAELLSAEGWYAKRLYALLATHHGLSNFGRNEGQRKLDTKEALVNSFLDHGNYIAYGYAAVALHALGISFAFPVMHGKTRRGGLVFDVADLVKDWLIMPLAFEAGTGGWKDSRFRASVIDLAGKQNILDLLINFIKDLSIKT